MSICTAPRHCGATSPGCGPSRMPTPPMGELPEPVLIVGTGLLGTSLGLALRRRHVDVRLTDRNSEHLRTATGLGAGEAHRGEPAGLVVVAVPTDHAATEI